GSIGIFGLVPNFTRTLDKIGVHTDGVGTTRYAGAFDITRPLDPDVGRMIQSVIDKGYADFIGKVANARGRSAEEIDAVARGRVWSGAQALERGLVRTVDGKGPRGKLFFPDEQIPGLAHPVHPGPSGLY